MSSALTMTTDDRFVDGVVYYREGDVPPPNLAGDLLGRLKVRKASRVEQERAVRNWLAENEPSPGLVRSLARRGFGHLLPVSTAS